GAGSAFGLVLSLIGSVVAVVGVVVIAVVAFFRALLTTPVATVGTVGGMPCACPFRVAAAGFGPLPLATEAATGFPLDAGPAPGATARSPATCFAAVGFAALGLATLRLALADPDAAVFATAGFSAPFFGFGVPAFA